MKNRLFLVVFTVCISVFVFAQEKKAVDIMTEANQALEAKEYAKAVDLYEKVLAIPEHGMDVESINGALSQLKPIVIGDKASAALEKGEYNVAMELYKGLIKDYPAKTEIVEKAGKSFFNKGAANYKANDFITAASCFTISEKEFSFEAEKSAKYKEASLKKLAKQIVSEGKSLSDVTGVSDDNKVILKDAMAKVYVGDGNDQYKSSVEIINAANVKVQEGTLKTDDAAYTAELDKAKAGASNAIKVLEKALELDPTNANAQKLIDACKALQ